MSTIIEKIYLKKKIKRKCQVEDGKFIPENENSACNKMKARKRT